MAVNPGSPPTIDALPSAPTRTESGAVFSNKAAAFVGAMDGFGDDVDAVGVWMKSAADFCEQEATAAEGSANSAALSAAAASNVTNFKGTWSSLTGALAKPATVLHNGAYWVLLNSLADVTTSQPSPTNTDWAFYSGTRWIDYTASASINLNSQNIFEVTAADADITLPALTKNGFIVIKNSISTTKQVRILNPSYTIRGLYGTASAGTNLTMAPGDKIHFVARSSSILEQM